MNIEAEVFKKSVVDFKKIINYGFQKENDLYTYSQKFMNDKFTAIITIDSNSEVRGKVIDLMTNDEYLALKIKNIEGSFVNTVRIEYEKILKDIKNKCCISNQFIFSQTNRLVNYIKNRYGDNPQFLWENDNAGVFKNSKNKWYGIIMEVDKSKIMNGQGLIEVINVKVSQDELDNLLKTVGIYPAYHMNKKHWITIALDDTISDEKINELIDKSYQLVW